MTERSVQIPVRPLGPEGPDVTVVGFGGMPLSLARRPDEATGIRVLHAAFDAGMTLVDTADVYCLDDDDRGHNERLIAKAVAEWSGDRDSILLATKCGMARPGGAWTHAGRPEQIRAACDRSLRALGVDSIPLYQLHSPDPGVPLADSMGAFAELRDAGKVQRVGLSNVSVAEIEEAAEVVPIATVQNRLSPFFREALDEGVVGHCARNRIGFLAYSPVGGGRLNLRLPDHPALVPIAGKHGATPHEIVLAWVVAQGESVFVIPGARSVEKMMSSVRAAAVSLDEGDLAAIDAAEFDTGP
jgi:aryl-alcohol dehydrogenase-like predicted oxidoreductase